MNREHVLSDALLDQVQAALGSGEYWMAFDENKYFLDVGDLHFFKQEDRACDFAFENSSTTEVFRVIQAKAVEDVLRQLPYAATLDTVLDKYNDQPLKTIFMNQQNLDYLKENLKYMGFGEQLNDSLQSNIGEGKKEFTLQLDTQIGKKPFSATLYFKRSENTDMYFFNKWEGQLKNEVGKFQQSFYLNKGTGVTLKEGFNLLEGRSVYKELTNKEGEKYHAWLQLDKKEMDVKGNYKINHYHQNYGYDLERTLGQLPIKELSNPEQKDMLLKSLNKGNLQAVTFEKDGMADKLFISASPQYKSVNVYDATGEAIRVSTLEKRFDFSFRQEANPEVSVMEKAKDGVNHKEVEGAGKKQLHAGKDLPGEVKEEQKPLQKAGRETGEDSPLPKKRKPDDLNPEKSASKGKGLRA